jgi:hypothetical protein
MSAAQRTGKQGSRQNGLLHGMIVIWFYGKFSVAVLQTGYNAAAKQLSWAGCRINACCCKAAAK